MEYDAILQAITALYACIEPTLDPTTRLYVQHKIMSAEAACRREAAKKENSAEASIDISKVVEQIDELRRALDSLGN